jgi:hypothetical protein
MIGGVPGSLLRERIDALLHDPADVKLARSILGTDSPEVIAERVERYCREQFGATVARCDEFTESVGAVFVLMLDSGQRVVIKAHGLGESRWGTVETLASLIAVYGVQAQLATQGVPCADVLRPPLAWESGAVAAMSYLDGAQPDDAHSPEVRRAMARMVAEITRLAAPLRDTPDLPVSHLPNRLWPRPHNVLFDLEAPGGEWIDERARAARAVLDAASPPPVVAHTDFSAANVRVRDARVFAIYDMDSIALVDEVRSVASMAVHYTYTGAEGETRTSRDQARAFIADYEQARGTPFTPAERARLDAGAIYAIAYTARAEHSIDPLGTWIDGSMRARLREAPPRGYFE